MLPRIFCIAFCSIWRMRSAETLNSAASSCRVAASPSFSQRASMILRLLSSSPASAVESPSQSSFSRCYARAIEPGDEAA